MNESEAGRRLERVRESLKLGQKALAEKLGPNVGQSDVSRWESGEKAVPEFVSRFITKMESELDLVDTSVESDIHTSDFCYGATTFRRVWAESKKRIQSIWAEAIIRPSKKAGFADAEMKIRFTGVTLPRNDPLYLDCIGVVPELKPEKSRFYFDESEGSSLEWIGRIRAEGDTRPMLGDVEEVRSAKKTVGPFALAYQLRNVLPDDSIEVAFKAWRGVRTNQIDAIGVPVYGDCPVESLGLSVTFEGLEPQPTPTAQFYLLRRTLSESRPLDLVDGLTVDKDRTGKQTFSFKNLRYPRPGFGFCIAWGSLQ